MEDFYCASVLTGKVPVQKVLETDHVLAFYHTKPYWPIHIVVIPKKHISSFISYSDHDTSILIDLYKVCQSVAILLEKTHGACRILTNIGTYQDTKHFHVHVSIGEPLR